MTSNTERRDFLKLGAAGLAVAGLAGASAVTMSAKEAAAQSASDSLLRTVLNRGKLLCGTGSTNAPWHFENDAGELVGMDITMGRILAKALFDDADAVEFVLQDPAQRIPNVTTGKVDIAIQFMTMSGQRAQLINFSRPYYVEGVALISRPDADAKSFADPKDGLGYAVAPSANGLILYRDNGSFFTQRNLSDETRITTAFTNVEPVVGADGLVRIFAFTAGGQSFQLQAKRSNLVSVTTAEDPVGHANQAASGEDWFQLRGACQESYQGTPVSGCYHLAFLDGAFDDDANTVSMFMPFDTRDGIDRVGLSGAGVSGHGDGDAGQRCCERLARSACVGSARDAGSGGAVDDRVVDASRGICR